MHHPLNPNTIIFNTTLLTFLIVLGAIDIIESMWIGSY